MKFWRALCGVLIGVVVIASCKSLPGPGEVTPDGLERVPSRASGGVYRLPGAPFLQYKRLILEPVTISFIKDWEDTHKEVPPSELKRIREEAGRLFREEFTRELITHGKYTWAEDAGSDVLIITPSISDLDIPAPDTGDLDKRSYAPLTPSMQISGELRDAATGRLVGRVITFAGGERYGYSELREANRGTIAHDTRNDYAKWARLVREALNVAKVERPRPQTQPPATQR